MSTIEKTVEVNVPVNVAYNQWTQFEEFPKFMEGVESVKQLDDTTLHWVTKIGGQKREFDAKITEQTPDQRIAWAAGGDAQQSGVVTFHRLSDDSCRVMLQMEFRPDGFIETTGDALGVVDRRVQSDLDRFKEFIEEHGRETGAWRGEVHQSATR